VTAPVRVCVAGITGRTGSVVAAGIAAAADLELVAGVARGAVNSAPIADEERFVSLEEALRAVRVDVVVDYTHPAVVKEHVKTAIARGRSCSYWCVRSVGG
jgi:4-hydroxy-tetrahydrodipicolinate reductase